MEKQYTISPESEYSNDLTITKNGYILLILSILICFIGFVSPQYLILVVPGLLVLLSFIFSIARYLMYPVETFDIKIELPTTTVKAKQFLTVHVSISAETDFTSLIRFKTSSGMFSVLKSQYTILKSAKDSRGSTFIFYTPRRGKEKINSFEIQFGGILGFFFIETIIPIQQEIIVLPQPQRVQLPWKLKQQIFDLFISEISISRRGRGDDFLSLREFQFGDDLRHIHWRATAKHGKLISKEFEEPILLRFLIVVDRSMLMAGPKFEFSLSSVVELASVIRNSHHSCTILVHGDEETWRFNLGTSPSSYNLLSIRLHNIKPEGTNFNFSSLNDYIINNGLTDTVMIILSDLEHDPRVIADGYTMLKPNIQRLVYFACFTPGFGTLVFNQPTREKIYSLNEYYYENYLLKPKLDIAYRQREMKYLKLLNRPNSRFHVIKSYNTNIMLELQATLKLMSRNTRTKRIVNP